MANKISAEKRIRQTIKRNTANVHARSICHTAEKKVRTAVAAGNKQGAKEAFKAAEKILGKAAAKGVFHKKNLQRKISRLAQAVNKLA